jgi:hypothetical protein
MSLTVTGSATKVVPTPISKRCCECGEVKFFTSFSRNHTKTDGRQDDCKACRADRQRKWRQTKAGQVSLHKDYKRDRNRRLQRTFGISQVDWDAMFAAQGSVCANCRSADGGSAWGFSTDHDHETGAVRGIVCTPCNHAFGNLRDSPLNGASALVYLAAHGKALTKEQFADFTAVYSPLLH